MKALLAPVRGLLAREPIRINSVLMVLGVVVLVSLGVVPVELASTILPIILGGELARRKVTPTQ